MRIGSVIDIYLRFKPHILLVLCQIGLSFMYIITQASFNHGLSPFVYVTYRQIVGGLVMLPFAYFLERKERPKITVALLLEFFVLALLAVGLSLNMCYTSMKYTSPMLVSCMINTIASLTFILAVIFRLEVLNLRSTRGMAKFLGTGMCLGGAMTMTLYKGLAFDRFGHAIIHIGGSKEVHVQEKWLAGSLLIVASSITWSMSGIMQAYTLKRYPAPLSLSTWTNFFGAVQSAVFAAIVEHKQKTWIIGLNIDLWSILYGGVVISGILFFIQMWCTGVRGPVFVSMFNPLSTLILAILSYFVLDEKLYVGSVIGGIFIIMGLYSVLWGKEHDEAPQKLDEEFKIQTDETKPEGQP